MAAEYSPKSLLSKLDKALEEENTVTKYLNIVEKKTNVKKRYLVIAFSSLISLYLVIGYFAHLMCNMIGFVYPAYVSVKAIESPDKDDDTEWLIYWVVFATFSVAEFFSDILLSWFPFYFLAKCIFLLWCMAPVTWNGSRLIYMRFIRPFILRRQGKIDKFLSQVRGGAQDLAQQAQQGAQKTMFEATFPGAVPKDEEEQGEVIENNEEDEASKKDD